MRLANRQSIISVAMQKPTRLFYMSLCHLRSGVGVGMEGEQQFFFFKVNFTQSFLFLLLLNSFITDNQYIKCSIKLSILKDLPVHIFRDKNLLLPVNFVYKFMLIKRNKCIRICKSLKMKWHDI